MTRKRPKRLRTPFSSSPETTYYYNLRYSEIVMIRSPRLLRRSPTPTTYSTRTLPHIPPPSTPLICIAPCLTLSHRFNLGIGNLRCVVWYFGNQKGVSDLRIYCRKPARYGYNIGRPQLERLPGRSRVGL